MPKAPCACARAALVFDAALLHIRVECIRILDEVLTGDVGADDIVALLTKAADAADAEKQAVVKVEKDAAAAAARIEKAANLAEAEALKAEREASAALAKARAKEEMEAKKAAKATEAERLRVHREKSKAELELEARLDKEARAAAKEKEVEAKRAAKEAAKEGAAETAEQKRVAKERAAEEAMERKAAAERARDEAQRTKEEAAAIARREREEREEREAVERAGGACSSQKEASSSSAASISQQRLERAHSRMPNLRPRFSGFGNGGGTPAGDGGSGLAGASSYALMNVRTGKAAAALKAGPSDEEESPPRSCDEKLPEVDVPLPVPLLKWRTGGSRLCEFEASCGFHADCLSVGGHDREVLASIGADGDGKSVSLYSVHQQKVVTSLQGHSDLVCSVSVRSDGAMIASGSRDKTIRLWSVAKGSCVGVLEGCAEMITGLAFHPATKRRDWLFSGEKGGVVRLWSANRLVMMCKYNEHTAPVWSVSLGQDLGVSASHDKHAKVWQLPDDAEAATWCGGSLPSRSTLAHPNWVFSVSVADVGGAAGELAATGCGDRLVRLWSLRLSMCLRTFMHGSGMTVHPVLSVQLLGAGLLVSGSEDNTLRLWSLAADSSGVGGSGGECIAMLAHGEKVRGVALSLGNGGYVASCGGQSKRLVVWKPYTS